ncbi:PDDEXK nuclease domain-containing protein [Cystobacter ferrugineus]|uniref:DUF1016 domain-containing protein n=1 Tax=Cystobacter ferrugineus TaxID=83449 RepID=A0A1L9BI89_9BACT|nr:PDDEXK nuclease domain-containing protein [Cystobacter ferrugineus]OJH41977.1 hypothetical protein BON30_01775 [Cystobacter ferrugineus]
MTKRPSKMPRTVGSKKVAAPLRQSPSTAIEKATPVSGAQIEADVVGLVRDIGAMIDAARKQVSVTANAALMGLYWQIGQRVHTEVLEERRAEYGAQIVSAVGRQLEARYGRGFGEKSLRHMIRFARAFPSAEIVSALRRQLSWSHFKQLIYMEDELKRTFYAEMCRVEGWSTRALAERIDGMLFERTALSKKPEALIRKELSALREKGELSPALVFRDPYMLDFLELADTYSEKDLESAILREIERFLLELGAGFAFVERQKRITLDGDDYYLDLLGIHVAEYLTELPPREVLEERLHRAIEAARNRLVLEVGVDAAFDIAPTRGATPKRKGRKK